MGGQYNKRWHDTAFAVLSQVCGRVPVLAKSIELAGGIASFATWKREQGFDAAPQHAHREALWADAIASLQNGPVTVIELGVAGGDATRHWLSELSNPELRWHGFDTFTGLPESWGRGGVEFAGPGTFDMGGNPPAIDDPRVTWHVGLVEETLPAAGLDLSGRMCVLFDLDLYAPTRFALAWMTDSFKPGDVFYFDEAYDPEHERKALSEFLAEGHRVKPLGSTGIAVMVEYAGR